MSPALTFTCGMKMSHLLKVAIVVDGEAALRYARMRYDDPEGYIGQSKTSTICNSKISLKIIDFRFCKRNTKKFSKH